MFGKINPDELKQLRSEFGESSAEDQWLAVKTLWDDERTPSIMPADTKVKVLDNLNRYTKKSSFNLNWIKIASAILLPLLLTWGPYWYISRQNNHTQQPDMVVMADAGQKTHVCLPDGSKIWINSKSSLSYPSDFGKENRTVRLEGEGYFEIVKNESIPFHVETDKINVVVHGTKFNVSAHSYHPDVRVSLLEGSVSVENKEHIALATLTPQHTMKLNKENMLFDIILEDTNLTALWSQNKCRVEDASAEEVFRRMGYWYGMDITVENKNTEYRYGFTIKEESFREFLELINELTPLEYSINGEEVTIRYK